MANIDEQWVSERESLQMIKYKLIDFKTLNSRVVVYAKIVCMKYLIDVHFSPPYERAARGLTHSHYIN